MVAGADSCGGFITPVVSESVAVEAGSVVVVVVVVVAGAAVAGVVVVVVVVSAGATAAGVVVSDGIAATGVFAAVTGTAGVAKDAVVGVAAGLGVGAYFSTASKNGSASLGAGT